MQILQKDKVIFHFTQENPMVYTVDQGEIFWVETDDCYSGQIQDAQTLRPHIDISIMDCSVGPIYVNGIQPKDILCVEILAIDLAPKGVMVTSVGLGVLGDRITEPNTKIIPVHDGFAHFSEHIKIPLTPMLGVCGIAPRQGEHIHCAVPGRHGANMDTKELKVGSKLYLPVEQEGAGLAVGDLHACMGDGELSGTGLEIAGRICLRVTKAHAPFVECPVIEQPEAIFFLASGADFHSAMKDAVSHTVAFIERKLHLNFPDAYRLLSATCDIQVSQVVNDLLTVRCRVPKFATGIQSVVDV